jgi:hypothetical protein
MPTAPFQTAAATARRLLLPAGLGVLLSGCGGEPARGSAAGGAAVAFDDPRVDPATRAWFAAQLRPPSWGERYAGLIRLAGRCPLPVGRRPGSAGFARRRGEAAEAPPADPEPAPIAPDPAASALLADLLGATLVDAQDELLAAWAALGGVDAASPSPALAWMTQPPPWPPASVERLITRGGDRGLAMAQDLAAQLTPDAELRFWLIQSWLRTPRPIDGSLLGELAHAVDGRLAREPRFRSWLRCEWTAWARQRYRRVARLAAAAVPPEDRPVTTPP